MLLRHSGCARYGCRWRIRRFATLPRVTASELLLCPVLPSDADPAGALDSTMTRESTAKALAASRCPICLDTVEHPASLSVCGHLFCKPCIKAALHAKKECPVCRTEATHRMLRDTAVDGGTSSISGTASTSGRPCLEAGPGADCSYPMNN